MNWRQLQAFRETMVTGTVSGAAEIMGISQPAVSRLIDALEDSLSLTLFDRNSGRLVPTAEARIFYEEVCKAFVSYNHLEVVAKEIKFGRKGSLTISCLPAIGLGFLPAVIAEYAKLRPDVHVRFDIQLSARVEGRVSSQQIDLGLAEFVSESFGVEREVFLRAPYVLVLPEAHPLAELEELRPSDLANQPMVALAPESVCRRLLEAAFAEAEAPLNIVCETLYAAGVCRVVQQGLGVGIVDLTTAYDFRGSGIVIRRFEPKLIFNAVLMYPRHQPLSRAASEFLKVLRSRRNQLQQWAARELRI